MTTIVLHGKLAHQYQAEHKFANINKVTDCLSALEIKCKNFKKNILKSAQAGMFYEFIVNGEEVKSKDEVLKMKSIERIEIVPAICGKDPVSFFVALAINLLMAGITYLMTPAPQFKMQDIEAPVKAQSFLFTNKENTSSQGSVVPLGYGRLRIGSKIIGSSIRYIDRDDYKYVLQSPDFGGQSPFLPEYGLGYDTFDTINGGVVPLQTSSYYDPSDDPYYDGGGGY